MGKYRTKKAGEFLRSDRHLMVYILDNLEELGYLKESKIQKINNVIH